MVDLSSLHLLFYDFFQPVLSGGTSSNIKIFEGIPLLSYTMGLCEKIFQFLEAEDQKKTMMLSEVIRISKGEVINMTQRTVHFTELAP